jgi:hypothetical protein
MKKAAIHHDSDLFRDRGNSPHNGGGHRAERYTNIKLFFQSLNHFLRGNSYGPQFTVSISVSFAGYAVIRYRIPRTSEMPGKVCRRPEYFRLFFPLR